MVLLDLMLPGTDGIALMESVPELADVRGQEQTLRALHRRPPGDRLISLAWLIKGQLFLKDRDDKQKLEGPENAARGGEQA